MSRWMSSIFSAVLMLLALTVSNIAEARFTYEGYLTDVDGTVLASQSVRIRLQIRNPGGTCLLYQEYHTITTTADGYFSVAAGSGTREDGTGLGFDTIFQNRSTMTGDASCSYTPASLDGRLLTVLVSNNAGTSYDNLGSLTIRHSPMAIVAETVNGFSDRALVRVSSGTVAALSSGQAANLAGLLSGTSTLYVSQPSGTQGLGLPSYASDPVGASTGQVWYDSTLGTIRFQTGTGAVSIGSGGVGTVTQVAGGAGLSGGPITGAGTLSLAASGVGAGTYGQLDYVPLITVDTYGRITTLSTTAIALNANQVTTGTFDVSRLGYIPDSNLAGLSASKLTGTLALAQIGTIPASRVEGGGSGSVTAVGMTVPSIFSVAPPSVTSAGTFAVNLASQSVNTVFAGPGSLGAGLPSFRALVEDDIPDLSPGKITGTLSVGQIPGLSTTQITAGTFALARLGLIPPSLIDGGVGLGSVTSVTAGTGLSGGTITGAGTLSLSPSGVSAGSLASASYVPALTVDTYGRITTLSSLAISIPATAVSSGTLASAQVGVIGDSSIAAMSALKLSGTLATATLGSVPASIITGLSGVSFPMLSTTLGSLATPAYSFASDTDTGIYSPAANQLAIAVGGFASILLQPSVIYTSGTLVSGFASIGTLSVSNTAKIPSLVVGSTSVSAGASLDVYNGALRISQESVAATGQLQFAELPANGLNYIAFRAPTSIVANVTYDWPAADGTNGMVLTTNGGGILSWTAPSGTTFPLEATTPGTAALPAYTSAGNTNTGMFFPMTNSISWSTGGTERMRVDMSGVGIGTSAIAVGTRIDVVGGAIRASQQSASLAGEVQMAELLAHGTNTVALRARGTLASSLTWLMPDSLGISGQVMTVGSGGTLYWSTISGTPTYPLLSTTRGSVATPAYSFSADSDTGLFQPGTNSLAISTGGTARMTFTASGKVGIGTSNPQGYLEVAGTVSDWVSVIAKNTSASTNAFVSFELFNDFDNGGSFFLGSTLAIPDEYKNKVVLSSNSNGSGLRLETANGTTGIEFATAATTRMYLTANGSLGLGTVNPAYKLDVQGGDINASGSVRAAGVALSSDERLKRDIAPLDHSLEKILKLRGVGFSWRAQEFPEKFFSKRPQIGVIAQEVEAQFPELVDINADGYKAVNYPGLVAPLIEAVKSLEGEISDLRLQNQQLEQKNIDLGRRLEALEQRLMR